MSEWTPEQLRLVKRTLLGSWPGTITAWGPKALDAYLHVLQARGLTAEQVMTAIGTWPAGSDFPPSAPNLAAAALKDPGQPTFPEMLIIARHALRAYNQPLTGSYSGEAMMLRAREQQVRERLQLVHPRVADFIVRYGITRVRDDLGDIDSGSSYAAVRLRDLEAAWDRHCETTAGREVAQLAAGRRADGLQAVDPLAALTPLTAPRMLGSGTGA